LVEKIFLNEKLKEIENAKKEVIYAKNT